LVVPVDEVVADDVPVTSEVLSASLAARAELHASASMVQETRRNLKEVITSTLDRRSW
jgi:hypothetical protein